MPPATAFSETVELLRRAKAGDDACLGHVLERYRERLLARIRLMIGNRGRSAAESGDFLHNVFVKILERFDGFEIRDEGAFLRWATQIARNNIRDVACRKREAALGSLASGSGLWPTEPSGDTPVRAAARAEQIARLIDTLMEFDEDQRSVIELRHFEQMSFAEIGRRLGRSENAAQLLHTRALLRLSNELRRRGESATPH